MENNNKKSCAEFPWLSSYPPGINWHAEIPVAPLHQMLDDAAARFPDRPFLDFLGKSYTYRQIAQMVDRMAAGLQSLGIGKGDKIGLFLPNTPYYVIAFFGALKAGATIVNFNPMYAEREILAQIDDGEAETMVTLDLKALYEKLKPLFGRCRMKRIIVCPMADILPFPKSWLFPLFRHKEIAAIPRDERHVRFGRLLAKSGGKPNPVTINPIEDIAVLQYTGGTTGLPKAAMLTHANLFANSEQSTQWIPEATPGEERVLAVLPFFHVFAMTVIMNLGIRIGAEIILLPKFDLIQVMKTIHARRPTLFPAVPTIYTAINNHRARSDYDLSSIRWCISGGAALPVEIKLGFEKNTGCSLAEGYGLTESSPVATCNPLIGLNKPGSIGLPLPGTIIEIASLDDPNQLVPIGEKGEVCIRGPQVMKGYWKRQEETDQVLRNGRLHTGDVGVMDEFGYVSIIDRLKDMILCGGFNIYPRAIEEAIYLHPAVHECVVIGVPDAYRGQTAKAFVKLKEGSAVTRAELDAFLEDKLSAVEKPKHIEFRAELPKTMIGKLSRKELLEEEIEKRRQKAEKRRKSIPESEKQKASE
ncbi:Long-chain-fatty-acid--CoA ligase [Azospirillaceae bacterium]